MGMEEARTKMRTREQLLEMGVGEHAIRKQVGDGGLIRVHAGWYTTKKHWKDAFPEERHRMQVIAAVAALRGADATACSVSAAAVHDLPLYRHDPTHVHLAASKFDGRTKRRGLVARHEIRVEAEDRTECGGVPCTTLERTVFDAVRSLPFDAGVALADAALRRVAWDEEARTYDAAHADAWRQRMLERVADAGRARGVRRARKVIEFADGRADRPLESVSRVRFHELGFAPPRLQVAVPGPRGRMYRVDFGLDDAEVWGEADGMTKYFDLELTEGATPQEIFRAEKQREDWIRGTTGRSVIRWGMNDVRTADAFATRLRELGVRMP